LASLEARRPRRAWHNGGTAGFSTFAAYGRQKRPAVVVLSNANTEDGVDDIGIHLVAGGPLQPAGSRRVTPMLPHPIEPRLLDDYAGQYELTTDKLLTFTRDGDQLSFQLGGSRKIVLYPESARVLRAAQADITFSFETDDAGNVGRCGDDELRRQEHALAESGGVHRCAARTGAGSARATSRAPASDNPAEPRPARLAPLQ
jgi:hypothetical protein